MPTSDRPADPRQARAKQALAHRGEAIVARYLERRGYVLLGRNVRVSRDELDIVARTGALLVICEVRTRRSERFGPPAATIGPAKQARLRRAARALMRSGRFGRGPIRLDAAGVVLAPGAAPIVRYYPGAL